MPFQLEGLRLETLKSDSDRCREFAEACVVTNVSQYKKRNQTDVKKITEQIFNGKLAEVAVSKLLRTNEPDFQIYQGRKKSFSEDLMWHHLHIHVKSQTVDSAEKYGVSWSFQVEDPLIKKPEDVDFAALTVISEDLVYLYDLVPVTAFNTILREPVVHQLRHTKRVLYWEDLKFQQTLPKSAV